MTTVNTDIQNNRSEEEIIQSLDNVCGLFPRKDRNKCDTFIEQYTNELIHIIAEGKNSTLACTMLGVCV